LHKDLKNNTLNQTDRVKNFLKLSSGVFKTLETEIDKMKVTIINGNTRHGSTWNCKELFKQELSKYGEVEAKEFSLPKDMPHLCNGCFSCFYNGEHTCPHSSAVTPIIDAMLDADVIVLTSPVYAMDVTGQMKALLDHLCFMWFSHRPNPRMFNKVALTISTTAGAGLSHTTKTMKNSLNFWGVKRVYTYQKKASAMKWEDVSEKKMAEIKKEMASMARKINKSVTNIDKVSESLFRKILFHMMKGMHSKNTWNPYDRKHWENQGWIENN